MIMLQQLNQRWVTLQQVSAERAQTLGSAFEVQRYHRYALTYPTFLYSAHRYTDCAHFTLTPSDILVQCT